MRKSHIFFLWCGLCIIASAQVKSMSVSVNLIRGNRVRFGIKKPGMQNYFAFSNSPKANAKGTIHFKKHRLVAALLAFPLGIFGLHRMYLGSSPQVPFVYIVTVGGIFGILPFIDFTLILLSKNKDFHSTYSGNHHLFMWQKK